MAALAALPLHHAGPLDMFEVIADGHGWMVERFGEDEVSMVVEGRWTPLHVSVNWRDDLEGVYLACAFDLKIPRKRHDEVTRLTGLINDQLFLGSFTLWSGDSVLFRNGLFAGSDVTRPQCEKILSQAIEVCNRYFPAFQMVIWGGRSAGDALACAVFETAGQA